MYLKELDIFKIMKYGLFIFAFLILSISFGSSEIFPEQEQEVEVGFGKGSGQTGVNIFITEQQLNTSEVSVNVSEFLNTNLGLMGDLNTSQFELIGFTLTAVQSYWDGLYCQLTGCTLTGRLSITPTSNNFPLIITEDNSITGSGGAGISLIQLGSGDAKFRFNAGAQDWTIGPDQSLAKRFAISSHVNLGTQTRFHINPSTGVVTVEEHLRGNSDISALDNLLVGTTSTDVDAPLVVKSSGSFKGALIDALSGPRMFFDINGVPTAFFGLQVLDDSFVMRQFSGSGTDILLALQSGGGRTVLGTQPFIFRHNGNFEMMTDNGKLLQGLAEDVSQVFNATDRVVNAEVGSPGAFWTNFQFYDFDNDMNIGGDIDMRGNNILDVGNVTVTDRLFLNDTNHFIKLGANEEFLELVDDTVWIDHADEPTEGEIIFLVSSNKTNSDIHAISIMAQIGRNNSAGVLGNSWMTLLNNLTDNLTIFSNCFLVAEELNETLRVQCDSSDSGADFIVQDDIQAFGTMFADEGIRAETLVDFIMNGEDVNIQNGSLHIFTPVTFTSGVTAGDDVTTFTNDFVGGLENFINLQVDLGNWFATSSIFCNDGDCANAIGISGAGNIIIQANISTTNINSTSLNFVYSLVNILGANSFTVTANNNVGSGDVVLLTDSTNDVSLSSQSIAMPSSMWDQPLVSLNFECDVTNTNRQCFVDTIRVNGTAIATTLTNQSGFNSQVCAGDGTRNAQGICNNGWFYNASENAIFPQGAWNLSGASISGVSHSALTNLEFANSGHTFTSPSQVLNIGSYNFTTSGNITLGQRIIFTLGETIDNLVDGWIRITGNLRILGDLNVTNNFTGNQIYGELWLHDGVTIDLVGVGVYVNITGLNSTWNNGFTYDGNGTLTAQIRGVYDTQWHLSFSGSASSEYDTGIGINGDVLGMVNGQSMNKTQAHKTIGTGGQTENMGAGGNLCIAVGDQITMMIADESTPAQDATINNLQLNLQRIGDC